MEEQKKVSNSEAWERFKRLVKVSVFLEEYCGMSNTAKYRYKSMGKNARGNHTDFTDEEYKRINKGIKQFKSDLRSLSPRD